MLLRFKTVLRCYSMGTGKKTKKILQYFEKCHGYEATPLVLELGENVKTNVLKNSKSLDINLCSQLKVLSTDNMLSVLNSWANIHANSLSSSTFYLAFVRIIRKGMWKKVCWNHLVQITHFIGYLNGEEDTKSLMILLLHSINSSSALPSSDCRDLCIICEAAYRTSTALSSPNIRKRILRIFSENLDEITRDDVWLVMLLKIMILSNFYDMKLMKNASLQWAASGILKQLPFTTQCYIASFYANAGFRDEKVFEVLLPSIQIHIIRKWNALRVKDMSMLLWSLSTLAIEVEPVFLNDLVVPYLERQLTADNLNIGLNIIVQCCISLWMLGALPRQLWDRILTVDALKALEGKRRHLRDISRLNLMMEIIKAETALTATQLNLETMLASYQIIQPNMAKELERRPKLLEASEIFKTAGANNVSIEYVLTGLYVAGITLQYMNKYFHVDILDDVTTLADSRRPSGRLIAKVRLMKLQKLPLKHVYIDQNDVGSPTAIKSLLNQ